MLIATIAQLLVGVGSLTSVWLAGSKKIAAWPVLIASHGTFLAYSAWSGQWGFWLLNVGMIVIGARNWRVAARRNSEPS
jgi:hypothetical protein